MQDDSALARVTRVYRARNADATRALYADLAALGPAGEIAVNLCRAMKNSGMAKGYRRRSATAAAYDTKGWAMRNLAELLPAHAARLGLTWGWGVDPAQSYHRIVLYVDLPTGQVSFHTDLRLAGPDHAAGWDGVRDAGPDRLCAWMAALLSTGSAVPSTEPAPASTPIPAAPPPAAAARPVQTTLF